MKIVKTWKVENRNGIVLTINKIRFDLGASAEAMLFDLQGAIEASRKARE